ncbi:hypothetical protein BDZ97DRAFT_1815734 [Flammula alnicola]|nr:hypothetical protein BDZ97DRAFT_1815734 [Flammula alnicola]
MEISHHTSITMVDSKCHLPGSFSHFHPTRFPTYNILPGIRTYAANEPYYGHTNRKVKVKRGLRMKCLE